jgi:hypothetical protein
MKRRQFLGGVIAAPVIVPLVGTNPSELMVPKVPPVMPILDFQTRVINVMDIDGVTRAFSTIEGEAAILRIIKHHQQLIRSTLKE